MSFSDLNFNNCNSVIMNECQQQCASTTMDSQMSLADVIHESNKYIFSDLNRQPVYRNDTHLSSNLNTYSMPHNQETPTYFNLNHVTSQPQIVILNQATTSSGQLDVVNECEEVDEDEEGEDDEDEDDNDNEEEESSSLNKNENNLIFKGALFKTFDEFESKFQEFCDKTKQIYNTSKSALIKNNTNDECPYKTKLYTCVHADCKKKSQGSGIRKVQSSNNKCCKALIRVNNFNII